MRHRFALGLLLLLLPGCVSERHFIHDSWPFGNPNAPMPHSETAFRALGKSVPVTPIAPQAGDVWPGPVQPMPTIGQVEQQMNLPLGQGYTPSVPSPYPPGIDPDTGLPIIGPGTALSGVGTTPSVAVPNNAPLYNGSGGATLDSGVPGHIRNGGVGP